MQVLVNNLADAFDYGYLTNNFFPVYVCMYFSAVVGHSVNSPYNHTFVPASWHTQGGIVLWICMRNQITTIQKVGDKK